MAVRRENRLALLLLLACGGEYAVPAPTTPDRVDPARSGSPTLEPGRALPPLPAERGEPLEVPSGAALRGPPVAPGRPWSPPGPDPLPELVPDRTEPTWPVPGTLRTTAAVRVEPRLIELPFGETWTFTARVRGTPDPSVLWTVVEPDGGAVDAAGTYTAPAIEGEFHVVAASVADPRRSDAARVLVVVPPIDPTILPEDRRDVWNPGIPGGIPRNRQVYVALAGLAANGTGDAAPAVQQAIEAAGAAYLATGVIQEVVLPAGIFRLGATLALNRSGVVLRGQGPALTRLRYDGTGNAVRIGRVLWGSYGAAHGPWELAADGLRGSKHLILANADAASIEVGDILCIDEEDDPWVVRLGDGYYEKRQPTGDNNGPPLRAPGLWRSVTSTIRVVGKAVGAAETTLHLADPLHASFRTARHAQVFHLATEYSARRPDFEGLHHAGLEDLYLTGGPITTNNVAFSWLDGLEVDGNPGTVNAGTYLNPGGISGRSVNLFHAYRCEVRRSYIHHSRDISQGGGAYLLSLSSYTSETLVEDNIVVFGNKLIVGNVMGGGNVIAYNYVDNARTNHPGWQEGAIDLNHQAFSHHALVEGNWATNLTSDTTHGNAGWHVFFRNYATGQNTAPLYGTYPYATAPDTHFRRAAGIDGYHREATFVGNVLQAGAGVGVYQLDANTGPGLDAPAVWRIGWAVDGDGGRADDQTALQLLYRHGNWDSVTGAVAWDAANPERTLPPSLYRRAKPAFFGAAAWPWVDPTAATPAARVKTLPAKARYDAMIGP